MKDTINRALDNLDDKLIDEAANADKLPSRAPLILRRCALAALGAAAVAAAVIGINMNLPRGVDLVTSGYSQPQSAEYTALADVEIPVAARSADVTEKADHVILYETQHEGYTVQMTANGVYKTETTANTVLYADELYLRILKDGKHIGGGSYYKDENSFQGHYTLDTSRLSEWIDCFTASGQPLVAALVPSDGEYRATFFGVGYGDKGFRFDNMIENYDRSAEISSVGILLNSGYTYDPQTCILTDSEGLCSYAFDFTTGEVTALRYSDGEKTAETDGCKVTIGYTYGVSYGRTVGRDFTLKAEFADGASIEERFSSAALAAAPEPAAGVGFNEEKLWVRVFRLNEGYLAIVGVCVSDNPTYIPSAYYFDENIMYYVNSCPELADSEITVDPESGTVTFNARKDTNSDEVTVQQYRLELAGYGVENKYYELHYVGDVAQESEETQDTSEQPDASRDYQSEYPDAVDYSTDAMLYPLDSGFKAVTARFGYDELKSVTHYGIDIGDDGIDGANIYAAQSGVVVAAYNDSGYHGGYGNYVIIYHGGALFTVYAHCQSVTVSVGQTVTKGDIVGYVGTTGWSTGAQLHFEVWKNGEAVDPKAYIGSK